MTPHEFGRVLLHLAQRRGAMGFDAEVGDKGSVKGAIVKVQLEMLRRFRAKASQHESAELSVLIESLTKKKNRTDKENVELESAQESMKMLGRELLRDKTVTFGRLIADLRDDEDHRKSITTPDQRKAKSGPREWRNPVRNRKGEFLFHADRSMIRDEFDKLWDAQKQLNGPLASILTNKLRQELDRESNEAIWRHQGLMFAQRRQSWDLGTLGRCVLEPTERCAPHADMYASQYLVVETVNNLKIIELGKEARALFPEERAKIKDYLRGPLGVQTKGKNKGQPKRSVSVSDLRDLMGWGKSSKTAQFRFNIESDEERDINTDWFHREIVHGAITEQIWNNFAVHTKEGINRAILKHDPDHETDVIKLRKLVMQPWAGLNANQADALVAAWKKRPRLDAKRLNMSRKAVRNLLTVMDDGEPWPDSKDKSQVHWPTQIEARKYISEDDSFIDLTSGKQLDIHARRRYATGAKGATARDRHYMKKHLLKKKGELIYDADGNPLHEPPPAPLISNPVVRKAIHEVRRHVVDYLIHKESKPGEIHIELSREAKMGKKESDEVLFRNRLRNRIRKDIVEAMDLESLTSTQQRAAVDRVILCVQQGGVCALCGNQKRKTKITTRMAANGEGCEMAHIIPKGSGGHNGLNNLVLSHLECNREMDRRTPRQYWNDCVKGGFDEGLRWIEGIFAEVERPQPSEMKTAKGDSLWSCYFAGRPKRFGLSFDELKIAQFKKDVKDIQDMTERQDAATKYAARQVMAFLADAIFDGNGLPERGGERKIYATDGLWTSRLRREWGLFFDRHEVKAKGLSSEQEHERKEKNRGDHRHHAIDAVVIALCDRKVQLAWENREQQAEKDGINSADESKMEDYRRRHPIPVPKPFKSVDDLHEAIRRAVYGEKHSERPVSHRAVKRKLIGALHEETLFGPVVNRAGNLTDNYTAKKGVSALDPNHLRMPKAESNKDAIKRLTEEFKSQGVKSAPAKARAEKIVSHASYQPKMIDPPPGKSGIVRDIALRQRIRECLGGYKYVKRNASGEPIGEAKLVNPDDFTDNELKQAVEADAICHKSGVPIRSVVLLRTMSDPVVIDRRRQDYTSKRMVLDDDPASKRAYVGGNNHHIEIRAITNKNGTENWTGEVVPAFEVARKLIQRFRELGELEKPYRHLRKKLTSKEKHGMRNVQLKILNQQRLSEWKQATKNLKQKRRDIINAYPIVDRADNEQGQFVMSLCEGEMLWMRDKRTPEAVGYFVVAKLDKPQGIVLVPHWDARRATERKDSNDKKVADSKREQFTATPNDLKELAPPGHPHAIKVRVSPLGEIRVLHRD